MQWWILKFDRIDVTNALIVAAVLAVYTGMFAARAFAFFQARYRSLVWYFQLSEFVCQEFDTPHQFSWKLTHRTYPAIIELKALGHDRASLDVAAIFQGLLFVLAKELKVKTEEGKLPEFPDKPIGERWLLARTAMHEYMAHCRDDDIRALSGAKPNLWPLFNPRLFPDYMTSEGELIGMLVPRQGFIEIAWLRLIKRSGPNVREMLSLAGPRSDCGDCCRNCNREI